MIQELVDTFPNFLLLQPNPNVSLIIGQDGRIPLKVPLDKGDLGD